MAEIFDINRMTGSLYSKIPLDREQKKSYEVFVKATDGGGKFGYALIKVNVEDVNDNIPAFLLKEYKAIVKENSAVNTVVGQVRTFISSHISTYSHM